MKKILVLEKFLLSVFLILTLLVSCSKIVGEGDLEGVLQEKWYSENPYGMALVPQGDFELGKSSDPVIDIDDAPIKTVSVTSFYMDETEITNSEYRQFINWVRDSIVRYKLAVLCEELEKTTRDRHGIGVYAFATQDTSEFTEYQKYMYVNYPDTFRRSLYWDEPLIWRQDEYIDADYISVMDSIHLPPEEGVNGGDRMIDVSKLLYSYEWFDVASAASNPKKKRSEFIKEELINVYPDTLVWIKDFNYSYNEPMHNQYFHHSAYDQYPVVGVNWYQANAFCVWRTNYKNGFKKAHGEKLVNDFRLPTEVEWEYAARGGIESAKYPWGGPYAINDRGCYLANFKPLRGNYAVDNALYTAPVMTYEPNGYNLYDMAGNVSEWTSSAYISPSYNFVSDINPDANVYSNKKKVIRGGSWKDIAYFIEVSSRDYEFADSTRSYIGFRTIQDFLGTPENLDGNGSAANP